jgi:predicted ATPase
VNYFLKEEKNNLDASEWIAWRCFIDRGIPILAYMHYMGDSYPASFDVICREHVYSKIFILPPWEEIYVSDEARYETTSKQN